jgi:hypothetical protein
LPSPFPRAWVSRCSASWWGRRAIRNWDRRRNCKASPRLRQPIRYYVGNSIRVSPKNDANRANPRGASTRRYAMSPPRYGVVFVRRDRAMWTRFPTPTQDLNHRLRRTIVFQWSFVTAGTSGLGCLASLFAERKPRSASNACLRGGPGWTRTSDQRIMSPLL